MILYTDCNRRIEHEGNFETIDNGDYFGVSWAWYDDERHCVSSRWVFIPCGSLNEVNYVLDPDNGIVPDGDCVIVRKYAPRAWQIRRYKAWKRAQTKQAVSDVVPF